MGGGHAHVQVIRGLVMRPLAGVRTTLVVDRPEAVYSGMVPAFVAGECRVEELTIDVWPLARRAGARVVPARALAVDPVERCIELEGRPPLRYDVASLDVGSSVRGLEIPGVAEHALATRPIQHFVASLEAALDRAEAAQAGRPLQTVVVGGGAAGVELLFTLDARLRARGTAAHLVLVTDAPTLLPGASARLVGAATEEAARRGLAIRRGVRVEGVDKDAVQLETVSGPERLEADLVVWAAGAAPPPLIAASPLLPALQGFVAVRDTLQVAGAPDLFAAGDCARLENHPWVPRAGVYAVRQGPVLDRNLRAHLEGRRLAAYRPQRDFLALLNLGEGRALGGKWGLAVSGRGVGWLKDRIDRRFVRRFQALDAEGAPAAGLPSPEAMGMEAMACGGCAAKVGPDPLARALGRVATRAPAPRDPAVQMGLAEADDAALVRGEGGSLVLASVDGFRAFADDPWLVGCVAAANALSDIWAKGGVPRHALALVTVPDTAPERAEETLFQVLSGVRETLDAWKVNLLGGHSTLGAELFVGLAVSGRLDADEAPLRLAGARPGDALILTKPLGTGVLLAADGQGRARGRWMEALYAALRRPNAHAARVARRHGAHAVTDVTGFGLAGHLAGMLRASGVSATLDPDTLPALPGARTLLAAGLRSTYHPPGAAWSEAPRAAVGVPPAARGRPEVELLFDPQTAGGLLLALPPAQVGAALEALQEGGDIQARCIGELGAAEDGGEAPITLVGAGPAPTPGWDC